VKSGLRFTADVEIVDDLRDSELLVDRRSWE
jgi:hypothetical protein